MSEADCRSALSAPAPPPDNANPLFGAKKNTAYGRGHTAKRTTLQIVGGTYFGGMAGFLVFMFSGRAFSCGCPQGQNVDALERLDTPFIKIGGPTAFTLANSIAVYVIGRRVDHRLEGSLLPTLGGSVAGAALGAGLVVGLHQASGDFPVGAFIASIFLPALGGTLGYNWSMPSEAGYGTAHRPVWTLPVAYRSLDRDRLRRATTPLLPFFRLRF